MWPAAQQIANGIQQPVEGAPTDAFGRTAVGRAGLGTPSVATAPSSAIGTGGTVALTTGRTSTDTLAWVDVTVGSSPQANGGSLFALTFARPFNGIPAVDIIGADGPNAAPTALTVSGFTLVNGQCTAVVFAVETTLTASQAYRFAVTALAPAV